MSQLFYGSYNSYLNSKNCCKDLLPGPQGPTGPTGPTIIPTAGGSTGNVVSYRSGIWTYDSTKSFIIDHPQNKEKYLVHACLEGPEVGVYYRGKSEVTNDTSVTVNLPDYIPGWAYDFTITVTAIYDGKLKLYNASEVDENGAFTVYGENGKFNWIAIGKRGDINAEPYKNEIVVKGNGPYKWVE
jgi:hypothetical protein